MVRRSSAKDDKLWLDRLVLRKDDGEVVVCNLDSYTRVEMIKARSRRRPFLTRAGREKPQPESLRDHRQGVRKTKHPKPVRSPIARCPSPLRGEGGDVLTLGEGVGVRRTWNFAAKMQPEFVDDQFSTPSPGRSTGHPLPEGEGHSPFLGWP